MKKVARRRTISPVRAFSLWKGWAHLGRCPRGT